MPKSLTALIASGVAAAGVAGGLGTTAAVASAHGTHTPECTTSQLGARITAPAGGGAAGNQYGTLTLTNTSHRTCETGGWVGLGLESANGRALGTHAIRTDRSGERLVVLRPHARTTSQLHWSDVDASTDHAGSACFVTPRHILVTPPNSRVSLSLNWTRGVVCSDGTIDVTPLAPTR